MNDDHSEAQDAAEGGKPFRPTCRYLHGAMVKIAVQPGEIAFQLMPARASGGLLLNSGILLDAWECSTCGYTELFESGKW